ncbi:hypothetical protein BFJ72_g3369 [Fusarium proliferatum]|uniref:FAD dependent oxidoreductase domain-containing protein n=1 Tax=Gibberella intermedia TaxID=948311 RepID=A0A420TWX7_GIBIN|nr:hypothetical protein BFJ72_g3369 [Fusarium proliferatum]
MSLDHQPRNIVIIGGGVIGCCTAYYITRHPAYNPQRDQITILEASSIAAAASGKAGGLIALWAFPSCIVPLSFQLHADLAAHHGGAEKWGYRRIHSARLGARGRTRSGLASASDAGARGNMVIPTVPADLDWLHVENVHSYRSTGTPENTAQVIPYEFTTAMAELAIEKGANVILGRATSVDTVSGAAKSVTYVPKGDSASVTVPATDVVLCAGPWTRSLLPEAPIVGLRQHSVMMRPTRPRPLSGYMLFTEISLATSGVRRAKHVTAEVFTRPNNAVWAAGDTDDISSFNIPETAEEVLPDGETCDNILSHVGAISDELWTSEVLSRQACYLPNVEGDVPGPILGSTSVKRLWIASGHSCWGIQNGPGTGKIMAEFVYDGKAMSADVNELDIKHLDGGAQDRWKILKGWFYDFVGEWSAKLDKKKLLVAQSTDMIQEYATPVVDRSVVEEKDIEPETFQGRLLAAGISREEAIAQVVDVMFAGTDAAGTTMAILCWNLAQHPEKYDRVYKEVIENTELDAQSLPYLTGVVKESLRLSMANPTRFPRIVPSGGMHVPGLPNIPAGTSVGAGAFMLHHNPEVFPEPPSTSELARGSASRGILRLLGFGLWWTAEALIRSDVLRGAKIVQDKIEIIEWFNAKIVGEKIEVHW